MRGFHYLTNILEFHYFGVFIISNLKIPLLWRSFTSMDFLSCYTPLLRGCKFLKSLLFYYFEGFLVHRNSVAEVASTIEGFSTISEYTILGFDCNNNKKIQTQLFHTQRHPTWNWKLKHTHKCIFSYILRGQWVVSPIKKFYFLNWPFFSDLRSTLVTLGHLFIVIEGL